MIVVLKNGVPEKKVDDFIEGLKQQGFGVHVSKGATTTILGLLGDTSRLEPETFLANDIVESAMRVKAPYKMASRAFHPENTVVSVGTGAGVHARKMGDGTVAVIAGPCSVESEAQLTTIAEDV